MPHQRSRLLLDVLTKKIRLWPVICVIGTRQSGKSVLLRDLFPTKIKSHYVTMDSQTHRNRAAMAPESFTEPRCPELLIIDEVQKVSDLFDAIKLHVDQGRKPGMYVMSGSTEFSKMTGVRESLTGRAALLRLYPLTLTESHQKKLGQYWVKYVTAKNLITLTDFEKSVHRGGMPGWCFLRSEAEFHGAITAWLETTCYRDLSQVKGKAFDGALALEILTTVAQMPDPTAAAISHFLRRDTRVINRYLEAFQAILVLHKLLPHNTGVGKAHYLLCDSGLASQLGASKETILRTHILNEALATFEYQGLNRPALKYYRNPKTSRVPLVFEWPRLKGAPQNIGVHFFDGESVPARELQALCAFNLRNHNLMRLLCLTHTSESFTEKVSQYQCKIEIHPLRG